MSPMADACITVFLTCTLTTYVAGEALVRINVGGPDYIDLHGHHWQADNSTFPLGTGALMDFFSAEASRKTTTPMPVSVEMAPNRDVYLTERYQKKANVPVLFSITTLKAGLHKVLLHFVDTCPCTFEPETASLGGKRRFDVIINRQLVMEEFDLGVEVGWGTVAIKIFHIMLGANDNITISLRRGSLENPTLSGIEVFEGGDENCPLERDARFYCHDPASGCVSIDSVCDDTNTCSDGSDERMCDSAFTEEDVNLVTMPPSTAPATSVPSSVPSLAPTQTPTSSPTSAPTLQPTLQPTKFPTSSRPTPNPTDAPKTSEPSAAPSNSVPTSEPSKSPSITPPTKTPTSSPLSPLPSPAPTPQPSTTRPTNLPSNTFTLSPMPSPTSNPVEQPTKLSTSSTSTTSTTVLFVGQGDDEKASFLSRQSDIIPVKNSVLFASCLAICIIIITIWFAVSRNRKKGKKKTQSGLGGFVLDWDNGETGDSSTASSSSSSDCQEINLGTKCGKITFEGTGGNDGIFKPVHVQSNSATQAIKSVSRPKGQFALFGQKKGSDDNCSECSSNFTNLDKAANQVMFAMDNRKELEETC